MTATFAQIPGVVGISADWYVDNTVNGASSNNCTDATTACTITQLLTKTITSGQVIGIKCNTSQYREMFLFPANNVQFVGWGDCNSLVASTIANSATLTLVSTAPGWFGVGTRIFGVGLWAPVTIVSGSGTNWTMSAPAIYSETNQTYTTYPILTGADVSTGWTLTSGNGWTINVSTTSSGGTVYYIPVLENGIELTDAGSLAACQSTSGTFYSGGAFASNNPQPVCLNPTGGGNPNTNGNTYEVATRAAGVTSYNNGSGTSGTQTVNIVTRLNQGNNGSFVMGLGGIAKNVLAIEGGKHNVYILDNGYLYNVQAVRSSYPVSSTLFVLNANTPTGANTTYDSCIAVNEGIAALPQSWLAHVNTGGSFGTVFWLNSTSAGGVQGFASDNIQQGILYNVQNSGASASGLAVGGGFWTVLNSNLGGSNSINVSGPATLTVSNTTIKAGVFILMTGGSGPTLIDLEHDIFQNGGVQVFEQTTIGNVKIISKNNNFAAVVSGDMYWFKGSGGDFLSDFNNFPAFVTATTAFTDGTTNYTLPQWRTLSGQDLHSTP